VVDLYSADVAVDERGSRSRAVAAREGLREVIIKVTGSEGALELAPVRAALDDAAAFLQQFSYREAPSSDDLIVRLRYDESALRRLLLEAGAPLWASRRPAVLLWLVADGGAAGRQFVDGDSRPALGTALREAFARRGIPLRLPLYDLEDRTVLAPGTVWRLPSAALAGASERYGVEHVLAGRVLQLSDGSWLGDWVYLYDGERLDRAVTAPGAESFAAAGAALVAEVMAERYAVASDPAAATEWAQIAVLGVHDFAAYAAILRWLEGLDLVDRVVPEAVTGDRLLLRVDARAGLDRLAPVIELDDRLHPVPAAPDEVAARVYRWQR
jgi:hypothetical protein